MPTFRYQAVTRSGETEIGEMQARSAAGVVKELQKKGWVPMLAEPAIAVSVTKPRSVPQWRLRKKLPGRQDVLVLTRNLAALLGAGTSLDRSFDIMLATSDTLTARELVQNIQAEVRSGAPLSDALQSYPNLFSKFYISIVRAAEAGGQLSDGMHQLLNYLESKDEIRQRVSAALIYPSILLCVAGLSMLVLLGWVVPRLQSLFDDMGAALPTSTRIVIALSEAVASYWWLGLVGLLVVAKVFQKLLKQSSFRLRVDQQLLAVPLLGTMITNYETTHFCRSLGTLLNNGVSLVNSIPIARDALRNKVFVRRVAKSENDVREGKALSEALTDSHFPNLAVQLVKVGEETGSLDAMLIKTADIFDKQVTLTMQRLLAYLEPVLILFLGVGIAAIIISMLAGIISINQLPM